VRCELCSWGIGTKLGSASKAALASGVLVWNSVAWCCWVIDDLIEKRSAHIAGLSRSAVGCGQHTFQQLIYKELSFQMQPKGLGFFNLISPKKNRDYGQSACYYLLFSLPGV